MGLLYVRESPVVDVATFEIYPYSIAARLLLSPGVDQTWEEVWNGIDNNRDETCTVDSDFPWAHIGIRTKEKYEEFKEYFAEPLQETALYVSRLRSEST